MAAEAFLNDLDELSSDDEAPQPGVKEELLDGAPSHQTSGGAPPAPRGGGAVKREGVEDVDMDGGHAGDVREATRHGSLDDMARVGQSAELRKLLGEVAACMATGDRQQGVIGSLNDDPEYQLIVRSIRALTEMEHEVGLINKYLRDLYSPRFPELEQLLPNAMDYARVVQRLGNSLDLTAAELGELLPNATIMTVSVAASTTGGVKLSPEALDVVHKTADMLLSYEARKRELLAFVESRMAVIAPNLSALVGTTVAAQLASAAGGLSALSRMPSCNIQALGIRRKDVSHLSQAGYVAGDNYIYQSDIVTSTPPHLRKKAVRLIAGKAALVARFDAFASAGKEDGAEGRRLRECIESRLAKMQEPPPAKQAKPLPVPFEGSRKRRGGRRARKRKEAFQETEMRKQANRLKFGTEAEEEFRDGEGFGMLGKSGSGRVRVVRNDAAKTAIKRAADAMKKKGMLGGASVIKGGTHSSIAGVSTSLAFTPIQGIELQNPHAQKKKVEEANAKYFGSSATFHAKRKAAGDKGKKAAEGGFALPEPKRQK